MFIKKKVKPKKLLLFIYSRLILGIDNISNIIMREFIKTFLYDVFVFKKLPKHPHEKRSLFNLNDMKTIIVMVIKSGMLIITP